MISNKALHEWWESNVSMEHVGTGPQQARQHNSSSASPNRKKNASMQRVPTPRSNPTESEFISPLFDYKSELYHQNIQLFDIEGFSVTLLFDENVSNYFIRTRLVDDEMRVYAFDSSWEEAAKIYFSWWKQLYSELLSKNCEIPLAFGGKKNESTLDMKEGIFSYMKNHKFFIFLTLLWMLGSILGYLNLRLMIPDQNYAIMNNGMHMMNKMIFHFHDDLNNWNEQCIIDGRHSRDSIEVQVLGELLIEKVSKIVTKSQLLTYFPCLQPIAKYIIEEDVVNYVKILRDCSSYNNAVKENKVKTLAQFTKLAWSCGQKMFNMFGGFKGFGLVKNSVQNLAKTWHHGRLHDDDNKMGRENVDKARQKQIALLRGS